jgi:hypothetical protein
MYYLALVFSVPGPFKDYKASSPLLKKKVGGATVATVLNPLAEVHLTGYFAGCFATLSSTSLS